MASDETAPLTGNGRSRRSRKSGSSSGGAAMCNLYILIALCGAVIAVSVLFSKRIRSLSAQLATEESEIEKLQNTVESQQSIIDRFSERVTNSDVLAKVDDLQTQLEKTEKAMNEKLTNTQINIENILNRTLDTLDKTVSQAQDEIQGEVDRVKGDVDSYVRTTQDQFSMENSFMVYQLAGTFTLLASLISMWHMTGHLRNFNEPFVQRKILAILWMSPVYGITSWLSLIFPAYEGYFAVVKDFYEAYVIYQFLSFLIAVLGKGEREKVVDLLARHADHLKPPFRLFGCCLPDPYESPRAMADAVLLQCQTFTMQFVFLRPLTTIGIFACNKVEYYGPFGATSATDYRSFQFWMVMVQNLSVFIAFSGLLKFYHAVHSDLEWCRPFPKFLCIKGIVFMTFWQGLAIAILANTIEATPNVGEEDPELWAKQAQNFLICLEMLLFSIAHFYCFPTEEWEEGYRPAETSDAKFGDNIALHDFFQDLKLVLRQGKKKKKEGTDKSPEKTEPPPDEEGGATAAHSLENGDVEGGNAESEGIGGGSYDEDDDIKLSDLEDTLERSDVPVLVREATARLLHSIQDMSFEPPNSPNRITNDTQVDANNENRVESDEEQGRIGGYSSSEGIAEEPTRSASYGDLENITGDVDDEPDSGQPVETTSLLGGGGGSAGDIRHDPNSERPGETLGLLGGDGSAGDTTATNIMGGTSGAGDDDVLHPSIFTTLGKFS